MENARDLKLKENTRHRATLAPCGADGLDGGYYVFWSGLEFADKIFVFRCLP